MIPRDQIIRSRQSIEKIINRALQVNRVLKITFDCIQHTQEAYRNYCQKICSQMIEFQSRITKNCHYQSEMMSILIRFSQIFLNFSSRIKNSCQTSLKKIFSLSQNSQLQHFQMQLAKKSQTFYHEFQHYLHSSSEYNSIYFDYIDYCKKLDLMILKFKSYSDPLKFYDKTITTEFQEQLQSIFYTSKNQQSKVTTELQLLDSKRKFLDQIIQDIRELFTQLFHTCIKSIQVTTESLINSFSTEKQPQVQTQIRKIDSIYQTPNQFIKYSVELQSLHHFDQIFSERNELIQNFNQFLKTPNQRIVADHKLLIRQWNNFKIKKQTAEIQSLNLYQSLMIVFEQQIKNFKDFEKSFKERETKIFGLNGKDTYKRSFQAYFGPSVSKLHELIFVIVESPFKVFQQLIVWVADNFASFKSVFLSKKESIAKFSQFYDQIQNQHQKHLTKFSSSDQNELQAHHAFHASFLEIIEQLKYIFSELEARQTETNKVINEKVTLMHHYFRKQFQSCLISTIVQNHKQNLEQLHSFKIISQTMSIFKNDAVYSILYEQVFGSSLFSNFESMINEKQYEQAEAILQQKSLIAKKMLKRQIGCCGLVKASPIDSQILSVHKCFVIRPEKSRSYGVLKVLKDGLIFKESKWNPFAQKVYILVPKSDVKSISAKSLEDAANPSQINQAIALHTEKGSMLLIPKQFDQLFTALQKIYGEAYRKILVGDKKGVNKNDSIDSGRFGKTSAIVSYNKDSKIFSEQPVFINLALSKMSLSSEIDRKSKGSALYPSAISVSEETKLTKIISKSQSQQDNKKRNLYQKLIVHYEKQNFLPKNFKFLEKNYKSKGRKDFQFKDPQTHNEFILKQLQKHEIVNLAEGLVMKIYYEWKIAYPARSPLLSFKHGEVIYLDLNPDPPIIQAIEQPHVKNQILSRNSFYESVRQMNRSIWKYLVKHTNKEFIYEQIVEKQSEPADNSDSFIIDYKQSQIGSLFEQEQQIKWQKPNEFSKDRLDLRGSSILSVYQAKNNPSYTFGESGHSFVKGKTL